jgi:hypothetical protein
MHLKRKRVGGRGERIRTNMGRFTERRNSNDALPHLAEIENPARRSNRNYTDKKQNPGLMLQHTKAAAKPSVILMDDSTCAVLISR